MAFAEPGVQDRPPRFRNFGVVDYIPEIAPPHNRLQITLDNLEHMF